MTLLMGFVLILALFFWKVSSRYEWNIPLKWQAYIGAWKERLSNKSYSISYFWESSLAAEEMEKSLLLLQKGLPSLQRNNKHPLLIEVEICQDLSLGDQKKYIVCLQRRFSEIRINVSD